MAKVNGMKKIFLLAGKILVLQQKVWRRLNQPVFNRFWRCGVSDLVLAIDQGTTGSTVALMNAEGRLLTSVNHEFPQIFPQPGWVEHDPEAILESVLKGLKAVFADGLYAVENVAAIGITNQRETAVLWDAQTGKAIHNAIVWQCRRTTDVCEQLKA